jgi:hypothetical protein
MVSVLDATAEKLHAPLDAGEKYDICAVPVDPASSIEAPGPEADQGASSCAYVKEVSEIKTAKVNILSLLIMIMPLLQEI